MVKRVFAGGFYGHDEWKFYMVIDGILYMWYA